MDDSRSPGPPDEPAAGLRTAPESRAPLRLETAANGAPVPEAPDRRLPGRGRLWFAFLGAPVAWAANLLLGYSIQATVCNAGYSPGLARLLPVISSVIAAAVAIAAGLIGYRSWRGTGTGEENPESLVSPEVGRSWFMSYGGVLTSLLFLLAIVLTAVAELTVSACAGT